MIRVTSPGAAQTVWINPDHITKLWQRADGLTMLRFVNGETMQISETPASFLDRLPKEFVPPIPVDNSYAIRDAIKDQTRQLYHLNVLVDAYLKSSRNPPYIPTTVPYVSS